ncbi:hypothetical protein TEA_026371 [Camellia sinensis var. sinensis]|uniref:Uncharacterized protein n=1 Tax=Camellia sinensis var. sinensis TaxID=542762 RepID=A0A4S4D292_CAMSN|nr:hypothetical protein TEA_026371 [Camellia sinensis var. sinensis]
MTTRAWNKVTKMVGGLSLIIIIIYNCYTRGANLHKSCRQIMRGQPLPKFSPKWEGPYKVVQASSSGYYKLESGFKASYKTSFKSSRGPIVAAASAPDTRNSQGGGHRGQKRKQYNGEKGNVSYPCGIEEVKALVKEWVADGELKLPYVEEMPSKKDRESPEFCALSTLRVKVGDPWESLAIILFSSHFAFFFTQSLISIISFVVVFLKTDTSHTLIIQEKNKILCGNYAKQCCEKVEFGVDQCARGYGSSGRAASCPNALATPLTSSKSSKTRKPYLMMKRKKIKIFENTFEKHSKHLAHSYNFGGDFEKSHYKKEDFTGPPPSPGRSILVAHNQFFAVKLSDRWSKQQRTSNPYIVEIADCDDVEVYIEALSLMYCKDLRKKLMKEDVTRVLGILKAFAFSSTVKAKGLQSRASEKEQRRLYVQTIDRSIGEPAPEAKAQFVECPNDINGMIDAAKFADLALLLIDGSYGFEMETFEFLNILQNRGFPKIMGVLTHIDKFKDVKKLKKTKQRLKHRFWTEIYDGAKLFYLSGLIHGNYHQPVDYVDALKPSAIALPLHGCKSGTILHELWRWRVENYWNLLSPKITTDTLRNLMNMKANLGSFGAALKEKDVWVMNVVPEDG